MMNELTKRAIVGVGYAGLFVAALWFKTPLLLSVLILVFTIVGAWEYARLVGLHRTRPFRTILLGLMAYFIAIAPMIDTTLLADGLVNYIRLFKTLSPVFILPLVYYLYIVIRSIYSDRELMPSELAKEIFGLLYIALPLHLLVCKEMNSIVIASLASIDHLEMVSELSMFVSSKWLLSQHFVLFILICIWLNDVGAYLVGSKFGRRPLFPSVSPKKSWEGFWGGLVASVLGSLICWVGFSGNSLADSTVCGFVYAILFGVFVALFSTWGDLFESMLKRQAGVKDSGALLPGHGGILDRIDSLLFAMPALWLFDYIWNCFAQ